MKEDKRLARNEQMLEECFPWFRTRLASVIEILEDQNIRPRIQQAWRSPAEQLEAFNTGHSKLKFGYHNATGPNGEKQALAVDILDDDAPLAPSTKYLLSLAIAARDHRLSTGLDWGLPAKLRVPIAAAITARDNAAKLSKIGWDPCHIEITGISVADVKAGVRPRGR